MTVYGIAWNEKLMLPFFVKHYRSMLHDCHIVIYSNESDDGTDELAIELGCEVRIFKTSGRLCDRTYLDIKNNCWKDAQSKWVLIADIDEHVYVTDYDLTEEEKDGVSIIKVHGWNMVNEADTLNPLELEKGIRSVSYDKLYCFDRTKIKEINYLYGCHHAKPVGQIKYSRTAYNCRHYKYLNLNYMIERHAIFKARMSDNNKKLGLGFHYGFTPEQITKEFNEARRNAIVI